MRNLTPAATSALAWDGMWIAFVGAGFSREGVPLMKLFAWLLSASFVALTAATSAGALSYTITAIIDGLQEVPANITPGTGTLAGTYDDVTNFLAWSGSFSGLIGTTTDAHFHGPAAAGVSAGVQIHITAAGGDTFPIGVTSGSFSGDATLTATQETQLLGGLWYVNIHSTFDGAGEIRGQVSAVAVPEPPAVLMLVLGLIGLGVAGRRR